MSGYGYNRCFLRFINKYKNPSNLGKQLDISNNYSIKTFIPNIENGIINLTVLYRKNQPIYYFPNLPLEINEYIHYFVNPTIHVQIQIKFDDNYPFTPTVYRIVGLKNTINNGIDKEIYTYLKYKTKLYNEYIKTNWTPAILIEKNILDFFTTINNMDELSY